MRNSLRFRITVIFISLATVPLLIVSLLLAQRNFSALSEQAINLQSEIAQRVAEDVANLIENRVNELSLLVNTRNIMLLETDERINTISGLLTNQETYENITLLDSDGQEIVRVEDLKVFSEDELTNRADLPEFLEPQTTGQIYYSPIQFNETTGEPFMIVAIPAYDVRSGEFSGVLTANLRFRTIWDLMSATRLPGNGVVYLVDAENRVVAHRDPGIVLQGTTIELPAEDGFYPGLASEDAAIASASDTFGTQTLRTVAEQESNEALALAISNFYLTLVAIVVALIAAVIFSVLAAQQIVGPIEYMAITTEAVAAGDLSQEIEIDRKDEIGTLAKAFNLMTAQLRELIGSLEQLVTQRTRALEASMEVSRSVSTILDQRQLVSEVVEQVGRAFDYYHVHIYTVDENTNDLIMTGGTGEAGQALLGGGHKIAAGKGLVGRAATTKSTVLVSNVEEEEGWLPNPLLPDTKAEIAVPMVIGNQVLGVLDVQQNEAGSLTEADAQLLESVANQVAIALRNARLFEEAQTQARQEAIVNAIGQKLQTAADIESVLQIAAQELGNVLNTKRAVVQLGTTIQDENGHQ
jgi:putative methionine-R-sulfoxide reductase with GAF domain